MTLQDFYADTITTMGMVVGEDGFIKIDTGEKLTTITSKGLPLVMPTSEHINTILTDDGTGKIAPCKILYNPLDESVIKGDSVALTKAKLVIEKQIAKSIAITGSLLLRMAENPALQTKTTMSVNGFLGSLGEAQNPGIKKVVDNTTVAVWDKIYTRALSGDISIVKIFLKKGGVKDGVKYNRLATLKSELLETIRLTQKDEKVVGVKLRNKDTVVLRLLLEYLLPDVNENAVISLGSTNGESPGFVALYHLYLKVLTKTQSVLKGLRGIDDELFGAGFIKIKVKPAQLDNLDMFRRELLVIPSPTDISRQQSTASGTAPQQGPLPATTKEAVARNQAVAVSEVGTGDRSLLESILYRPGSRGVPPVIHNKPQPVQQTYLTQQQLQNQQVPQQVAPLGINSSSIGQPQYEQQVYTQMQQIQPMQQQYPQQMQPQQMQPQQMQQQAMYGQQQPYYPPMNATPPGVVPVGINPLNRY